jgi:group I intron endonuclease
MNPTRDRDKKFIFNDNKKAGIYMFTNKLNNKQYIGSAIDLNKRISAYFQKAYLNHHRYKKYLIVKAINKYGIDNFYIYILEYTDNNRFNLIKREQYWIDNIKPEYNILRVAGCTLGYKHTEEAKLKIFLKKLGKKLDLDVKRRISSSLKISKLVGHKHTLKTKLKLSIIASNRKFDPNKGLSISIKDINTGIIKVYKSVREAAKYLKADTRTIRSIFADESGVWIKPRNDIRSSLFRNKYIITLIPKKKIKMTNNKFYNY